MSSVYDDIISRDNLFIWGWEVGFFVDDVKNIFGISAYGTGKIQVRKYLKRNLVN